MERDRISYREATTALLRGAVATVAIDHLAEGCSCGGAIRVHYPHQHLRYDALRVMFCFAA
jgi:hypothetical protein